MTALPQLLITVLGGIAILFFGRKLFWLYVAVVGFLVGIELAPMYLTNQPDWIILVIGIVCGLVFALFSVFLQYVAAAVAGFFGGAYLASLGLGLLSTGAPAQSQSLILIIAGVVGAILLVLIFDIALIFLSAVTGAVVLVQFIPVDALWQYALIGILAVIGISFQLASLPRN